MFAPHEGGPATATRSRRRQRPISSESIAQQPKAKRQRLPLTEQTFVNPDVPPEMFQVKPEKAAGRLSTRRERLRDGLENRQNVTATATANAPVSTTTTSTTPTPAPQQPKTELSVRSKKAKAGERSSKGDGSVVLASNTAYTVSKLPALPDRLRNEPANRQHGIIYTNSGYAISLSHTHALVWPYTANIPSPETFTFALPYPSRQASDPLPLGALVAPSASSEEPGLVVIMPATGKISYWESISSAATLGFLRQQRTGIEDTITGLSSTEHVRDIINAEPAGFILQTSSGRLAYMSVRDGHGRPAISVQFLRSPSSSAAAATGFFGSLRYALKHSAIREDVVAVHAGPVCKIGERTVVSATAKAKFSAWRIQRGGSHDPILDTDARESLSSAIRQFDFTVGAVEADSLQVVDFAFVPKDIDPKYAHSVSLSSEDTVDGRDDDERTYQLLALVALPGKKRAPYYLVELILVHDAAVRVGMVRPIKSLSSLVEGPQQTQQQQQKLQPRLYLPKPAVVAYLVFDRAVVIASLAQPPETPDSQLQSDSHQLPPSFEDVVDLRNDSATEIVGSGAEEPLGLAEADASASGGGGAGAARSHRHKTKNPALMLLVRGVGVVRLSVADVDRFVSERPPEVTAKSKLEQAVFFGIKESNPLLFEGIRPLPFSEAELGAAALELSRDILGSKTAFTPSVPISLESNLLQRASYLDRLMSHLNAQRVNLSRDVRWRLLWNAEKMAVAHKMWVLHEQFLADRADGKDATERKTIISEIVEYIHEDEKKKPNREAGEVDHVRHFFVNDVWRMDLFVAWAYEVIKYVYKDNLLDDRGIIRLMYEGVEVNCRALVGSSAYRVEKLAFYGLEGEPLLHGILAEDGAAYEGLPEPWTSTSFITNNAKRLVDLCCRLLDQFYPPPATTSAAAAAASAPDPGLIESIRESLPTLTDRYLLTLQEHYRWAQTRTAESERIFGERCEQLYQSDRYAQVIRLKNYELWDEAIEVAKRHNSLAAMAEVMVEEVRKLRRDAATVDAGTSRAAEKRGAAAAKEQRISEDFDVYREPFAFAVYGILLRDDGVKAVLDFPGDRTGYATKFLRAKPELAKISWINDVEREKDVDHAAETLLTLGLGREQQVWNKKIELSLGKLALLAEQSTAAAPATTAATTGHPDDIVRVDRELLLIRVQDLLYRWVLPSIATAVDEAAELQLAMEAHAVRIPKRNKALLQLFRDGLNRLLRHEALDAATLIDLLTLIHPQREEMLIEEDVFFLALQVADAGLPAASDDLRQAQRLIWRRCFVRDDWAQINNTQLQDDDSTASILGLTAPYLTVYALCIQHIFDGTSSFAMVKPSEALGAYTDPSNAATAARFASLDDGVRDKLMDAMRQEDLLLLRYIDKCRLEDWCQTAVEGAQKACQAEIDRLTARQGSETIAKLKWRLFGARAV